MSELSGFADVATMVTNTTKMQNALEVHFCVYDGCVVSPAKGEYAKLAFHKASKQQLVQHEHFFLASTFH